MEPNQEEVNNTQEEEELDETIPHMTKSTILQCCRKHDLYPFPDLNDTLYLHYEGFPKIKNLEEFINVKTLWLNNNQITTIENLSCLKQLTSLNLQHNLISEITGLDELVNLNTLMLSNNYISEIQGLSNLHKLETLEVDYNHIKTADAFQKILECPSIKVLNIVHNQMDDPGILDILGQMQNLMVLRMDGNPLVPHTKNYRKFMISKCPKLIYLDDENITEADRQLADAFKTGGKEAEMKVRQQLKEEKRQKEEKDFKDFRRLQREAMLKAGGKLEDYPELMSSDDENLPSKKKSEKEPKVVEVVPITTNDNHVGPKDDDVE